MSGTVRIDCSQIGDWPSFHQQFAAAFGFPPFYGENYNAWIDCMSRLDDDFSVIRVRPGELITLQLDNTSSLKSHNPEILTAIFELAAFVNWRRLEMGEPVILCVSANV